MIIFKKFIHYFLERPDVWFFYGFLITFTLSIRKVLFFYPINGAFNEYTGTYLYLSDVFLFLTIATWIFILCNKYSILSIFKLFAIKCSTPVQMFHVEHYTGQAWNILIKNYIQNVPRGTFVCLKKVYKQVINNYVIIFPLLLAFFSFLSILWASNQSVALFRSIKLFEFILLYFYIIYNVPRSPRTNEQSLRVEAGGTFLEKTKDIQCSTWNIFSGFLIIIIISGFIQSIIGFVQFFTNHSIGLFWLRESVLSPEISGVAKIIFDGTSHIRAYGLFPHPNIFGGFLVVSIVSSLLYLKMFHVEHFEKKPQTIFSALAQHNVPRGTFILKWNNLWIKYGKLFLFILGLFQVSVLLLTFSKSAIIGLFIGFFYIAANNTLFNVPSASTREDRLSTRGGRGTFSRVLIFKMFHVEHFWKKIILLFSISALLFFIIKPDMSSLFLKSLNERSVYLNVSRGTFVENPFFGIGAGQFVPNIQNTRNLEMWQFQPVHNVFLLILNEYGIFILFAFVFFLYKMFRHNKNVPRGTFDNSNIESLLRTVLLAFIFIMFFDHYLWDIQQGQIMLWAIFGLIVASQRKQLFG